MATNEVKEEGSCCSDKGRCCRCGAMVLVAIVLLLLGGIIGFLMGSHCAGHRGGCPMEMMAPTAPAK